MTTLTPEDRERLRDLAAKATPGPWEAGEPSVFGDSDDKPQSCIDTPAGVLTWDDHGGEVFLPSDAEFVAAARTAVPALLDEVEALRAERDEALASLDRLHSWTGLMELLDEHWPESIFPTLPDNTERDAGPRIVSLIRRVDAAEAAVQRVRALHYPIEGIHCTIVCAHRHCVDDMQDQCEWPCATARAIEGVA